MDVIELLNEGRRGKSQHLDKGVHRAYYSLDGIEIPIIEKSIHRDFAHTDLDARRLAYWKNRGLRVPEIVVSSEDSRLQTRPERDRESHQILFLSDLTEGNKWPIVDLYSSRKKRKHIDIETGRFVDQLDNAQEVRNELADALALVASEMVEPRTDYFFVRVRDNAGQLYLVDIEYYHSISHKDLEAIITGKPKTNFLLPYSGLCNVGEIKDRITYQARRLVEERKVYA